MEKKRFVVIGGVAAGMSAASRARKLRPDMEIVVFEKSGYVSHAACGMPYAIAGKVKSSDDLVIYDARFFREKRNIEVFLHHEVKEISPLKKTVLVRNLQTDKEREHSYDKLLISTGARAVVPPIKGIDLKGIFTLRLHEDGMAIKEHMETNSPKKGLILGAGSIGMEMSEALAEAGIKVTIVERMPGIIGAMDDEITEVVEEELRNKGVMLLKGKSVIEFLGEGPSVKRAILESGEFVDTDMVIVGTGLMPNSEMAKRAGVELGKTYAIKVNERMETNIPDIYAAGDCAEAYHLVLQRDTHVPLGLTANKQGRVAGENVAGGNASFAGIVGTAVFKVFDLEVARTGITEKEARIEGIDHVSNVVDHLSRAHYYPDASRIRIKLIAERKSGRILGAQMVGREGVSKRIDVLATAITAKLTAHHVADLDLSYAPPFAPVYDPILVAADELRKKLQLSE